MSATCPRHGMEYGKAEGDLLCTRDGCYHASIFNTWQRLAVAREVLRLLGADRLADLLECPSGTATHVQPPEDTKP